ncbi:MAG TPA: tagaturonate epimerase family protein [Ktedonobacteraceae bacterium]
MSKDYVVAALADWHVQENSVVELDGTRYFLVTNGQGIRQLAIVAPLALSAAFQDLTDVSQTSANEGSTLLLAPLNAANAAALRRRFAWLNPSVQGLRAGAGLGDRLGLATPGHLRAVRAVQGKMVPFPAQQSIREMTRTGRSPQEVLDDATWGVFAEGWRAGFGADADHLKTPADIDACLAAGYTFYTFDPGAYVESAADQASAEELSNSLQALPWDRLADTPEALLARYLSAPCQCEGYQIEFDALLVTRAAVKYGHALAHVALLYQHLARVGANQSWEVEVSVDETETPTTPAEHVYLATELRRLGVEWVSLAPRYPGRFEKGVDYIGDLAAFEAEFAIHAAIARVLGPYKLSLHSGSDKFSVYAIAARQTRGVVHLKTAGTSYLEALHTIARLEPELLRAIYTFARACYEVDRASYHVSASLERAPLPESLLDTDMLALLEQFDAREILHVTFGSVLTARTPAGAWLFYERLMTVLRLNPEVYASDLQAHFIRHLQPFVLLATD